MGSKDFQSLQELMILSDQVISGVYISTEEPWPSGLEHGVKLWETYGNISRTSSK